MDQAEENKNDVKGSKLLPLSKPCFSDIFYFRRQNNRERNITVLITGKSKLMYIMFVLMLNHFHYIPMLLVIFHTSLLTYLRVRRSIKL